MTVTCCQSTYNSKAESCFGLLYVARESSKSYQPLMLQVL